MLGLALGLVGLASSSLAQQGNHTIEFLPQWILSPEPTLRIRDDGRAATQFGGPVGAVRMPGGELIIAEPRTNELRVFTSRGEFVRNLSRAGQGPGEFQGRFAVTRRNDTVFVIQAPPDPSQMHTFTRDGFVERRLLRDEGSATSLRAVGRMTNGAFLVAAGTGMRFGAGIPADALLADSVTLGVLSATEPRRVTWLGTFLAGSQFSYRRPAGPRGQPGMVALATYPFGASTARAVSGELVWLGNNESGLISLFDSAGTRVRQTAFPIPPRALSSGVLERARRAALSAATSDILRSQYEAMYSPTLRPATAPVFSGFRAGVDGEMWVSVFNEDSSMPVQYVVLDGLANPIARAVIPADLRITEIGRDYVLGVRADGDGLQEVVLFRLVRR